MRNKIIKLKVPSSNQKFESVEDNSLTKIKPNQVVSQDSNRLAVSPSPMLAMSGIEEISILENKKDTDREKKIFASFDTDEIAEMRSDSSNDNEDLFSIPKR
jgi:predicted Mrr-cat superfamily restriction endonuclease